MSDTQVKEGDQVSWQWSGSRPSGTVAEVVTEGQATITTQRGNEVSKNAEPNDPAIAIERSGNDVVKKAHEVDVEQPGDKHKEDHGEEKATEEDKKGANGDAQKAADGDKEANGEAQTGEKRKAEEPAEDQKEEESVAKKQKTDGEPEENGDKPAPKKKGRPAKNANGEAKSKETKKREPKKAATETGEPRRSGRVASKSS